MPSSAENVKLGVCNVLFDGRNLGYTKGGVEVEVTTSTHPVTVDQTGETPIGELVTGRQVKVTAPLAETTLDNLVAVMPGSTLITDGAKASGSVTFKTAAPVNGDKIVLASTTITFKTVPAGPFDLPIPATIGAAASALADVINASNLPFVASANAGVTTITAKTRGVAGNVALVATFVTAANVTAVALTGGVDVTKAQVKVSTGVNINLLSVAKTLVLRPIGTTGADDFTVYKAACPGAINFTYQQDAERIYSAVFTGYAADDGGLFAVGDVTATGA
ncbi:hypothetical protein [Ancylobacter rudongensis]|uniref:Uncharacterized protein n=1 Tax=Ancylobacter rudongensis TaxID=177413 RepID=A0A1G4URS5_9HYPH|nr:hypothetical protein [Ancylobacter rudongensis]SCW95655.1 hypothetical protein SAMN05660859_0079 [Ancylobacter rudongensis]